MKQNHNEQVQREQQLREQEQREQSRLELKQRRRKACLTETGLLREMEGAIALDLPEPARGPLRVEVRHRLGVVLNGDETGQEAEDIFIAMVDPCLLEWKIRMRMRQLAMDATRQARLMDLLTPVLKQIFRLVLDYQAHRTPMANSCPGSARK